MRSLEIHFKVVFNSRNSQETVSQSLALTTGVRKNRALQRFFGRFKMVVRMQLFVWLVSASPCTNFARSRRVLWGARLPNPRVIFVTFVIIGIRMTI